MLVSLNVKNFAIIDNIQIDFNKGMNVLTGETGAGKSIIIDAIGLLFGDRASNDMIRFSETKAIVEGVFTNLSNDLKKYLEELGIELLEDDEIIIKREIINTGKSVCRVNNNIITLNQLISISEFIGDIHSQHDTIGLINQKNYLKFISTPEIDKLVEEYGLLLLEYNKRKSDYLELLDKNNTIRDKVDFLEFQLNEFNRSNISINEEEDLKKELQYLSNFENITSSISKINEIFYDDDALGKLYSSIAYFEKLSKYDQRFLNLKNNIEESYYQIEEVLENSALKINNDIDLNRIDEINARLSVYSDLKRKHRKETKEIIEYFESIKKELDLIENYSFHLEELKKLADESYIKALELAKNIRDKRIKISGEITKKVKEHLQDLQIKNAQFEIVFNELTNNIILKNDGIDTIDFLVSFNKGEPLKPLSKTASGGEMSRFMLALKSVMNVKLSQSLMIFDEIDSGVSGTIAHSIGEKIKSISKTSQVICITHLPQVACLSETHFKIYKVIENNQTYTRVKNLNYDERIKEIASMISNGNPSEASINLAMEFLSTTTNF